MFSTKSIVKGKKEQRKVLRSPKNMQKYRNTKMKMLVLNTFFSFFVFAHSR